MQRQRTRVLCVDDEPHILKGLRLQLRKRFEVITAANGAEGLEVFERKGPFPIVLSDMRMPIMNGAAFLSRLRTKHPTTVRMLLTGQSDLNNAVLAVNEGQIFRFLTKPCSPQQLISAMDDALKQYQLAVAEREVLAQTLKGCVQTMTNILAISQPGCFGWSVQLGKNVRALAEHMQFQDLWRIEVAGMLSLLGTVALSPRMVEKLEQGIPFTDGERIIISQLPKRARDLIGDIPRLEPVREILSRTTPLLPPPSNAPKESILLKAALDYDLLINQKHTPESALCVMERSGWYTPDILQTMKAHFLKVEAPTLKGLLLHDIEPGMVLAQDVRNSQGQLLMASGLTLTTTALDKLSNFGIAGPLTVYL